MKKRRGLLFICMTSVLLVSILVGASKTYALQNSFFDYYNQKTEYEISTEKELLDLADIMMHQDFGWNVTEIYTFQGVTIKLTDDIKMTKTWVPIGPSRTHPFAGTFDGNGHTISNIRISDSTDSNLGVFGYVTGEVKNLTVSGKIKTKGSKVGGITGTLAEGGVITNCSSDIDVTGKSKVGGIAGENVSGTITGCHNSGRIHGGFRVGGITGENWDGTIEESFNEGDVQSYIKGFGTYGTGGIAGRSVAKDARILESCNRGKITSVNECAGGIAGYCSARGSTISDCSNLGDVEGASSGAAGGIIGSISQDGVVLQNSYNAGQVTGKHAGGVIGSYYAERYEKIGTHVHNNYYVDSSNSKAIGLEKEKSGQRNYPNIAVAKSINQMRSTRMADQLSPVFRPDSKGISSINDGFPVFTWQKAISKNKGDILQGMEIEHKQNFIDFYKQRPYGTIAYGQHLMEAIDPQMVYDEMINVTKKGEL